MIKEYRDEITRFEERGYVSDVLLDMARIQNIKDKTGDFPSVTILYSKKSRKKWTDKFSNNSSHKYIFLDGNSSSFFQELEQKLPNLKSYKVNNQKSGKDIAISRGNLVKGRAEKGSKFLFQNYVNLGQTKLNQQILNSSPLLLSFIDRDLSIQWKSPLQVDDYQEYRNEFLELFSEWKDKKSLLETYWAKQGPQWDGIAVVKGKNKDYGLLLVEAKSYPEEMKSKIQAKDPKSVSLISGTIEEVMRAFESQADIDIWLSHYYQLANRLAYLYILNEKLGIPTWLVLVNFVDDDAHIQTNLDKWLYHYHYVFTRMDISFKSIYGQRIITVFPRGDDKYCSLRALH